MLRLALSQLPKQFPCRKTGGIDVVLPNIGLLSVGAIALCAGAVMSVKERAGKQLKCSKCGAKEMRARAGHIVCKNGHRIVIDK
jgi:hypothetical protein